MGYTFISYSRKQLYFAEAVALELERAGIEIWFDLQKLSPGVNWAAALKDGYGNCERLVFIASQAALQSPYVQIEWETALENGREVIVLLAEAVVLPESLRSCPVYDARAYFDRTVKSLIRYLRGEESARHDTVPAPERSLWKNKMPHDIWLTAGVMLMPAITIWIATLNVPPDFTVGLPDSVEKYAPGILPFSAYLVGFGLGLIFATTQFPIRSFLQHTVSYEELAKLRRKLFQPQLIACVFCVWFTAAKANPVGYLILIFPLITAYWSLWTLKRSPDLLRWLPSGEADQDVREKIQKELVTEQEQPAGEQDLAAPVPVTYAIHSHPADRHIAEYADSILRSRGCRAVSEEQAATQLLIVSNRTSKQWLIERNAALSGQKIHILGTNINTPPEIQSLLQTQWIDFRNEREKILQTFAAHLANQNKLDINYAMQISPTDFDNSYGFPRSIRILLGAFLLLFIVAFLPIAEHWKLPDWVFILCVLPLVFYMDALIMRKASLPRLFHRTLGKYVAWFASPAPRASDPLGNKDRNYIADRNFLLLVDFLRKE